MLHRYPTGCCCCAEDLTAPRLVALPTGLNGCQGTYVCVCVCFSFQQAHWLLRQQQGVLSGWHGCGLSMLLWTLQCMWLPQQVPCAHMAPAPSHPSSALPHPGAELIPSRMVWPAGRTAHGTHALQEGLHQHSWPLCMVVAEWFLGYLGVDRFNNGVA